jgi:hypothetical protein
MYTVTFTKPCCDNHSKAKQIRIRINSEVAFFNKDAETWSLMMDKTKTAIRKHKREVNHGGLDFCSLDYKSGIGGVYMANNESARSLWKLVYSSAENKINKLRLQKYEKSQMQKKFDELMKDEWSVGEEFSNNQAKYRAVLKVEEALGVATNKSTLQAETDLVVIRLALVKQLLSYLCLATNWSGRHTMMVSNRS